MSKSDLPQPEYLTTREVANLLRVRERKVYEMAAAGEIPCLRVTGKLLFPRTELERWLAASEVRPNAGQNIIAGSHDPLLDWAIRQSGAALATMFNGSLDGLERMAAGDVVAAGLHLPEEDGQWNGEHVRQALPDAPVVLMQWCRRQQGLLMTPALREHIQSMGDVRQRKVMCRQHGAGGQQLFQLLCQQHDLVPERDFQVVEGVARTEFDTAAAVANGHADVALGLEAMARQFGLAFVPLLQERFDVLIQRRACFEPPFQALWAFCRSGAVQSKATELGGYDLSAMGRVHWNAPN